MRGSPVRGNPSIAGNGFLLSLPVRVSDCTRESARSQLADFARYGLHLWALRSKAIDNKFSVPQDVSTVYGFTGGNIHGCPRGKLWLYLSLLLNLEHQTAGCLQACT